MKGTLKPRGEMYFSFDIEASGPSPSTGSMIALGMVVCGTSTDGKGLSTYDLDNPENAWYSLLSERLGKPWGVEEEAVHGISRDRLVVEGKLPSYAMRDLTDWIYKRAGAWRPIAVAYPLSFDWSFLYDYFCKYIPRGAHPFGFSGCLDIKTMFATKNGSLVNRATKKNMPKKIRSERVHSHNALDDAKEQAELFQNLWSWSKVD